MRLLPFDTDSQSLKAFLALAETLNFTRAAQKIGRSQSALSMQIRRLEDSVGRPLFYRTQRLVKLTHDGEVFLGYARSILDLHREAHSRLHEPEVEGEIRVGTPEDFATHYLPEVLAAFRALHPRVLLNISCDLTLNLVKAFETGQHDIVLVKRDPQTVDGGVRVWREPLVWVTGERNSEKVTSDKDLALTLALSPPPCIYRARALAALARHGRAWRIGYTSPSLTGTLAAVRSGLGISVLPANMIPKGVKVADEALGLPDLADAEIAMLTADGLGPAGAMLARHIIDSLDRMRGA
ncbi:bacterial regulatory helix-turn-helix protein, lysR family protein [Asticcacaulis biprosthecium C19]|uniref:Bacterial regulatory helix-turn-helix protein, lysR family protein n=1 Tax=Asticcacaulis biprosthecium C19 TaxID=715226 RepID=F4QMG8_9CAUL|nr:LysR family transcriptional regulator [Asticcacaulis biprosthecium]EGF91409.1 bacterial regulatory helix-turn-helix protein, lysR family protein [Asticcacaulis biprosthecium C19]